MADIEILRPVCLTLIAPHVIFDGNDLVAVCPDPHTARRIAELWARHGLADVPDTPEGALP